MLNNNTLLELRAQYEAPLYVYDADTMIDNYQRFDAAFQVANKKIYYACKALSNINILQLFRAQGAGLDCVSIQEVMMGIEAGFEASNILFTPNNISEEEFDLAVGMGVNINVDNINMLEYFGAHHPNTPICLRINPHLMAGGNRNISVGHIDSKFGISIHQVPLVKRLVDNLGLNINGIHVHTGSDILDAEVFIRAAELVFSVVEQFDTVDYIDFGSGFKVAYKPEDLHTDIEAFGRVFSERFNAFCAAQNKDYTLCFEPGKYLVSNAGYFLANANVIKQTTSCIFVGVDSGFNHLIRPMFYDAYHHITNASNAEGPEKIYSVVGYVCESDTFAVDRRIAEVRKGDLLVFHNAGAYCFSMASNYNARYRPAEVLMYQGQQHLIRQREAFEDLMRKQVNCQLNFEKATA